MINAAIFSAFFFAMLHGMNSGVDGLAMFNLFLYGLFAALLFVDCENIWIVGALHSVWNFVQGNLYGISVSGNKITSSIFTSTSAEGGASVINGGSFGCLLYTSIVVCFGLIYSTFMTLYIVPIMYDILYRKQPKDIDTGSDDMDDIPDEAQDYLTDGE